jgi:hypothetical protein
VLVVEHFVDVLRAEVVPEHELALHQGAESSLQRDFGDPGSDEQIFILLQAHSDIHDAGSVVFFAVKFGIVP